MTTLIFCLLNPFWFFLLAFVLILKYAANKTLWLIVLAVLFYLFSTSFIIRQLVKKVERSFESLSATDLEHLQNKEELYIMVLGAGKNNDTSLHGQQRLSLAALARLTEGITLYRQLPHAKLITSGPKGYGDKSQAVLMQETAVALGVDKNKIICFEAISNTKSEAKTFAEQIGKDKTVIVCTAALHMPRALAWFRKMGVNKVYAAPSNYQFHYGSRLTWQAFLPTMKNLYLWQSYLKEKLGMGLVSSFRGLATRSLERFRVV